MAKIKKPAPKGGKKADAPKKVVKPQDKHARALKRAIKKAESAIAASEASNKVWSELSASVMAGKLAKPSPVTENPIFKGAQLDPAFVERALHPTVEEQWADAFKAAVTEATFKPKKPSMWARFRSAVTGLFVSKKYAEANPDTTVRERVD